MAPQVGLEPTTTRLTAECSAIELLRKMDSGSDLLSRAVSSQVPSALKGLTSVFGMGTGGTPSSLPPEIVNFLKCRFGFSVCFPARFPSPSVFLQFSPAFRIVSRFLLFVKLFRFPSFLCFRFGFPVCCFLRFPFAFAPVLRSLRFLRSASFPRLPALRFACFLPSLQLLLLRFLRCSRFRSRFLCGSASVHRLSAFASFRLPSASLHPDNCTLNDSRLTVQLVSVSISTQIACAKSSPRPISIIKLHMLPHFHR